MDRRIESSNSQSPAKGGVRGIIAMHRSSYQQDASRENQSLYFRPRMPDAKVATCLQGTAEFIRPRRVLAYLDLSETGADGDGIVVSDSHAVFHAGEVQFKTLLTSLYRVESYLDPTGQRFVFGFPTGEEFVLSAADREGQVVKALLADVADRFRPQTEA